MQDNINISMKIINYIKKNNISTKQIEKDTGIASKKLLDKSTVFTATEFLELCSYLNLEPEKLR